MAKTYSDQITVARNAVNGAGNTFLEGVTDLGAKERISYFSLLSTAAAAADTIDLVQLPKNARLMSGHLFTGVLGASVTLSLGTDLDMSGGSGGAVTITAGAANLLAATSTAAASATPFAATLLLGAGAQTVNGPTTIYATVGGATLAAGIQICGFVRYIQN